MKLINEYINYLKDNPKGYWFKSKRYGWGWVPATKEGWSVMGIYFILFSVILSKVDKYSNSASDTLFGISLPILALTALLILVCFIKGEKPHWSWGNSKKKK